MIKVENVTIDRLEGFHDECGWHDFETVAAAEAWLREAAATAPDTGGYNKCEFVVHFNDCETYEGRIDLKREHATSGYSIAAHITDYLSFLANTRRPGWMNDTQWEQAKVRNADGAARAAAYLAKYGPALTASAAPAAADTDAQESFLNWMGV